DGHLAGHPARLAADPRDRELDEDGLGADGHGAELPLGGPMGADRPRPAGGTAERRAGLPDGEQDLAADVLGADVLVAAEAEPVVQEAGGHAGRLPWGLDTQLCSVENLFGLGGVVYV